MASSLIEGYQGRSLYPGLTFQNVFRGQKFRLVPDFFVPISRVAAADLTGANSGFWVFTVPKPCTFIGAQAIWATAGAAGNTARVKKVLSAATSAPGAAADANNVDISVAIALDAAINTRREYDPVVTSFVNKLAAGDKVAIASAAGTTLLAGAEFILQFAWD